MTTPPTITWQSPYYVVARWRSAVIVVSTAPASNADVLRFGQTLKDARAQGPWACLYVMTSTPGVPASNEGSRDAITRVMREYAGSAVAAAAVVQYEGFASALLRGLVTGVLLAVRPKTPTRIFADVATGAAWLDEQARAGGLRDLDATEMRAVVAELGALVGADAMR